MFSFMRAARSRRNVDQGIHNVILHKKLLGDIQVFENDAGPVMTLGAVEVEKLRYDDAGRIINRRQAVVNTLHQYDRHPALAKMLLEKLT
jgi:hypothetical protein